MSKPFLLGGDWIGGANSVEVHSPFDGALIDSVALADLPTVQRAISLAQEAFDKTKRAPAFERATLLEKIAQGIHERAAEFAEVIVAEAGKPITFAEAEVARAELTFRFAAREAAAEQGGLLAIDASAPGKGHFGGFRRFPIGLILGISPFNFPLNLVAHKVAPTIATGNVMILKPALKTPLSALLLGEVLMAAGMPPGQVQVVPFDHELMPEMLKDERIKMISFTGSVGVGWKLKEQAGFRKIALELGGNAGLIVHSDADWRSKLGMVASGAFGYAGQSCISVQRIFIQDSIYAEFRDAFVEHVHAKVKSGDPRERDVVVGPMINRSAAEKVYDWLEQAVREGAKLLTPLKLNGNILNPIVLENVPKEAKIACEEAFAPVVVLEPYSTFEEAIGKVNDSRFALQAGVFTCDINLAWRAFNEIDAGGVMINQVPTFRTENLPYGGIKESGFGREGVKFAMEEMTEIRNFVFNWS